MQGKSSILDLKKEPGTESSGEEDSESSAYQQVSDIILSKQMVRSMVGLSALLRKTHIYEVLNKLSSTVEMYVIFSLFSFYKFCSRLGVDNLIEIICEGFFIVWL